MTILHCWADEFDQYEIGNDKWVEVFLRDRGGTCMLPAGHDGPHTFTPNSEIGITFREDDNDES